MLERFAPVDLSDDLADVGPADRAVLALSVRAARCMDDIFWRQAWSGAVDLRDRLRAGSDPGDARALQDVELMVGPYNRLDSFRPFIAGVPPHPAGAAFYPDDLDREAFEGWLGSHPEDRASFESLYTVIRREGKRLVALPYREVYRPYLEESAKWLREAATLCDEPSLARYLQGRAEALRTDDYYQSDLDWLDVRNNRVDVTIGPYETYEDQLFGYKASYEAYVGIVDACESERLAVYSRHLDDLDRLLSARSPYAIHRGAASPIRVLNLVFNAGEARAGVQTTAFNLPNDERVHKARGTRKVLLRNVARAKFDHCMVPLAARLLHPDGSGHVTFEAYFTNVLLHEMAHSLGPSFLSGSNGDAVRTVRKSLREHYLPIEEAKADIVGLLFHQWLMDRGLAGREQISSVYWSFLAGAFRAIRFGAEEAHGKASLVALRYLVEKGSVWRDSASGRFGIDVERAPRHVADLAHCLVSIEARGAFDEARQLLERYGQREPEMLPPPAAFDDVPVDIRPRFPLAEQVAPVS